jgi:heme oxygenase
MRAMLRAECDAAHQRVDVLFRGGFRSIAGYQAYLLGMERLLRACRAALAPVPLAASWSAFRDDLHGRGHHVVADLRALGVAPSSVQDRLAVPGHGEAIGVLYVIEGSALGARGLARDVARLGLDAGNGAAFLHDHAGDAARWRLFLDQLEALPSALAPALREGALAAFAVAADAFAHHLGAIDANHPG